MDIEKLYEELGRADAKASASKRQWEEMVARHRAESRAIDDKHREERNSNRSAHDNLVERLKVMRQAVEMAEAGMDPLLAKLKATGEDQEGSHDLWDSDDDDVCDESDDILEL